MKCFGGPPGREGMLVACHDGQVHEIFVNNAFPCLLWKHNRCIRYTDISALHSTLGVLDDKDSLCVVNLKQGHVRVMLPWNVVSIPLVPGATCLGNRAANVW